MAPPRRKHGSPSALSLARDFRLCAIGDGTSARSSEIAGDGWFLELAWDGHRVLATRRGMDVHIASADFQPWHEIFAPIAVALRRLPAHEVVLEGHLCALDEEARPCFDRLRDFVETRTGAQVALALWDLLWIDGDDLRAEPLRVRRAKLHSLLENAHESLMWSEALPGKPAAVTEAVRRLGIRGVVARAAHSTYPPRGNEWIAWPTSDEPVDWSRSLSPTPKVTNADKVLYPRDGLTKTDIVAYYRDVAPVLLAHMHNRPIVGQRWPDGIDEFTWFQHRVPPRAPDYLRPTMIDGDRRIVIDDERALLWLVNLAAITFHGWASRVGSLDEPDWVIFDLDPGDDTTWTQTIDVALAVRKLLELLELPSVVKTSGQRGLHILVPLAEGATPQAAHDLAARASAMIARLMPTVVSLSAIPDERAGRLYLDHLQSYVGKALVLPYALRAADGAPVSTPIHWHEVTPALDPRAFNIHTVRARLDKHGDLAAPLLQPEGANIHDALTRLS